MSKERLQGLVGIFVSILLVWGSSPARADTSFKTLLEQIKLETVFPGAERLSAIEGAPGVAPVVRNGKKAGFVFLNSDFAGATGYSGKPIHVLVGMDLNGKVTGAQLVEHHEPIVLIGIPEKRITEVVDGYRGRDIMPMARGEDVDHDIDIVSGATVTIMVIDDSILRSAIKVARRYGLGGLEADRPASAGPRAIVRDNFTGPETWEELRGDGSVRSLLINLAEINKAMADTGDPVAAQRPEVGEDDETFIEMHAALVSPPTIGHSLLGANHYKNLQGRLEEDQHAVLIMGRGRFSFRGSGFVRGGLFDRIQLIQGDHSVRFRDKDYQRLRAVEAEGSPEFEEVALFRLPKDAVFDPTEPWRIELLVGRETGPTSKAFVTFDLAYELPKKFVKKLPLPVVSNQVTPAPATAGGGQSDGSQSAPVGGRSAPLWQRLWRQKQLEIVLIGLSLLALTAIFFAQDWLVKHPVLTDRIRIGFLVFTLFGIGFYANAQLSVVNVMTFFNALITDFRWDYFLMEPLVFMLWFSVAASLLLWGRGAYCGWLCPFGALQELLSRVAKHFKVTQVEVPWWLHERAWALKYILFLVLFGVSLYSLSLAEMLAEVEPFKTAIILKFVRDWPFVVFALALLAAGLFIERFYCRYLCPLGAALAIPGKLRLFEWLKRYGQCGSPCQKCATQCMVQAIHPEGRINPNECLYCLHCQVVYHDTERCPVVIQRKLRSERREPQALAAAPLPRMREQLIQARGR